MSDINSCEYVVFPKKTGKWVLYRALLISLYVVFVFAWLAFGLLSRLGAPLLALIPLTTWILVFFTWRYVKVEYEYTIESGYLSFCRIYGRRTRKKVFEVKIKDIVLVAPMSDRLKVEQIDMYSPEVKYTGCSSAESPDAYFALFENDEGKKSVYYFDATEKALKILRFYNPSATVVTKVRY